MEPPRRKVTHTPTSPPFSLEQLYCGLPSLTVHILFLADRRVFGESTRRYMLRIGVDASTAAMHKGILLDSERHEEDAAVRHAITVSVCCAALPLCPPACPDVAMLSHTGRTTIMD